MVAAPKYLNLLLQPLRHQLASITTANPKQQPDSRSF
jgi:hypothetical protein